MDTLPDEIIERMLLNLDYNSISNYCKTESRVRNICHDETFWRRKISHDYDDYYTHPGLSAHDNYRFFNIIYDRDPFRMIKRALAFKNTHPQYFKGLIEWILNREPKYYHIVREDLIDEVNTVDKRDIPIIFWLANRLNKERFVRSVLNINPDLDDTLYKTIDLILKSGEPLSTLLPFIYEIGEDILIDDLAIDAAVHNNINVLNEVLPLTSQRLLARTIESKVESIVYRRLGLVDDLIETSRLGLIDDLIETIDDYEPNGYLEDILASLS